MYLPPQFAAKDPAIALELMRAHPFASLISTDDEGLPFVTHLPLHLLEENGGLTLLGHCAKPNPHGRYLAARPQAVVSFLGPHAYMTPRVYPDLARVPTWNYLAVHAYGPAEVIHEAEPLLAIVSRLTDRHEQGRSEPWKVTDAPADYIEGMLRAIVGIRLPIARLQGARKLSQNRSGQDVAGVREGLTASPDQLDKQLAAHMRQA